MSYPSLNFALGETIDMLRDQVQSFVAKEIAPRAAQIDSDNLFPADMWRKFGDMGLLGITVPEEYGGESPFVPVSAKTGAGIDNLLEQVAARFIGLAQIGDQATTLRAHTVADGAVGAVQLLAGGDIRGGSVDRCWRAVHRHHAGLRPDQRGEQLTGHQPRRRCLP